MGTRGQIVKLDSRGKMFPVKLFKHGGDLNVVLPVLVPFAAAFWQDRERHMSSRFAPGEFLAQCLFAFDQAERAKFAEPARRMGLPHGKFGGPEGDFAGYSVGLDWHGDIEYLYVCGDRGKVAVYEIAVGEVRGWDLASDELPAGLKRVSAGRIARVLREAAAKAIAPKAGYLAPSDDGYLKPARRNGTCCLASMPGQGYLCTRQKRHDGFHAAHDPKNRQIGSWPEQQRKGKR